jgi:hypothetical protein
MRKDTPAPSQGADTKGWSQKKLTIKYLNGCQRKRMLQLVVRHFSKHPEAKHQRSIVPQVCRTEADVRVFLKLLPILAAAKLIRFKNGWVKPHLSLKKMVVGDSTVDEPREEQIDDDVLRIYESIISPAEFNCKQARKVPDTLPETISKITDGITGVRMRREKP